MPDIANATADAEGIAPHLAMGDGEREQPQEQQREPEPEVQHQPEPQARPVEEPQFSPTRELFVKDADAGAPLVDHREMGLAFPSIAGAFAGIGETLLHVEALEASITTHLRNCKDDQELRAVLHRAQLLLGEFRTGVLGLEAMFSPRIRDEIERLGVDPAQ